MRTIEAGSLYVPAMGYGAMAPEGVYDNHRIDDDEAINLIRSVVDEAGITHIDTADAYGAGRSETIVGKALHGLSAEDVVVATKVGFSMHGSDARSHMTNWGFGFPVNGRPDYLQKAVDQSLRRLGREAVVYLHYQDPGVPLEDSIGALAELKAAGKIMGIGLSNVTDVAALKRAHREHPIDLVQNEFSLQNRRLGSEVLAATKEMDVAFVAWAPLGAGTLTTNIAQLPEFDSRRLRFKNRQIPQTAIDTLAEFHQMANDIGATAAQLALAWIYKQGDNIVTIPGSRKLSRIQENLDALSITLDEEQLQKLNALSFAEYRPMLG